MKTKQTYRVVYQTPYADESESIGFRTYEEAWEETQRLAYLGISSKIKFNGDTINNISGLQVYRNYL